MFLNFVSKMVDWILNTHFAVEKVDVANGREHPHYYWKKRNMSLLFCCLLISSISRWLIVGFWGLHSTKISTRRVKNLPPVYSNILCITGRYIVRKRTNIKNAIGLGWIWTADSGNDDTRGRLNRRKRTLYQYATMTEWLSWCQVCWGLTFNAEYLGMGWICI